MRLFVNLMFVRQPLSPFTTGSVLQPPGDRGSRAAWSGCSREAGDFSPGGAAEAAPGRRGSVLPAWREAETAGPRAFAGGAGAGAGQRAEPTPCLAEDYPNGTWLGDENNPEMRVRCAIIPSDMLHISTNCRTAEKMALTLLDYLFHREVQAVSNLSGQGKHGKKQLDPLTIYGIRCECCHPAGPRGKPPQGRACLACASLCGGSGRRGRQPGRAVGGAASLRKGYRGPGTLASPVPGPPWWREGGTAGHLG